MPQQCKDEKEFVTFDDVEGFSDSELNLVVNEELEKLKQAIRTHHLCDLRKKERNGSPDGERP